MHRQLLRYVVVGVGTNIMLYLAYLLLTGLGLGHKTAMTLLYGIGILQSFLLNRQWTFGHHGHISHGFIRYLLMYAAGYCINLTGLYLLVDIAGFPHQIIQLLIAVPLAIMFFVLLRLWVFNDRHKDVTGYVA